LRAGLVGVVATVLALIAPTAEAAGQPVTDKVASCSWERPGHDPYSGSHADALARYADISPDARQRLLRRMAQHDYDELVTIRRDVIEGRRRYDPHITDMHFGRSRVCHDVRRDGWTPAMEERGLVYCDGAACVMVPTVCRNVSRVVRLPDIEVVAELPEPLELLFDPPGATPDEPDEDDPDLLEDGGGPSGHGTGVPWLPAPPPWLPAPPPWSTAGFGGSIPPVPSVPELPSVSMLLIGVAAVALLRLRRTRPPACGDRLTR
jgi:hypothetical protein